MKKNHQRPPRGKRRRVIACGHAVAELRSSVLRQPSCLSKRFYGGKGEAKALASEKKVGSWDQRSATPLPVRSPRPTLSHVPLEARGFVAAAVKRRLGLTVAREMARHRLRRVPAIGVPNAALSGPARFQRAMDRRHGVVRRRAARPSAGLRAGGVLRLPRASVSSRNGRSPST